MRTRQIYFAVPAVFLALAVCLVWTPATLAHRVYIFAWVEGGKIMTDSYFSKSQKVRGGRVTVFDPAGKKLLEGRTDENGAFSFKIPGKTALRLVLDAGMGHKAEWLLEAGDLPGGVMGETAGAASPLAESAAAEPGSSDTGLVQADPERIRLIVEKALDERLKPLVRSIAEL
ncbi:MAG: hypothetical protein SV487_07405, partial [Thermodesulfobacteriota bacterium]|nr:hypothetical protein [Thermodesulfobacteriota bacterium]